MTKAKATEDTEEQVEPVPAPTEPEATTQPNEQDAFPPPPPPLQAPVVESLAEQVQRQQHEIPDSQNPSDIVPNRPNIRPAPAVVFSTPPAEGKEFVVAEDTPPPPVEDEDDR